MENSKPYWYKIINYWVSEMGHEGLTIPFIIGAQKYKHNDISIRELFNEIILSDNEKIITLFYCPDIGENVLGMIRRNYTRSGKLFYNSKNNTSLIISDSFFIKGPTLDDVIQLLEEKYNIEINAGKFSFNGVRFEPFTQSDRTMIEKALD